MTSYSVLECHTVPLEIPLIDVSVMDTNGTIYPCASDDAANCQYQTYGTDAAIRQDSVAITSTTTLTFAGQNFDKHCITCDQCEVTFVGVIADSCQINSATEVIATFNMGVPISAAEAIP